MPHILCPGLSALDALYRVPVIPSNPTKLPATGFDEYDGGMAANAMAAMARLRGAARFRGRVGGDALGTRMLDPLVDEGVDVASMRPVPRGASPSPAILVDVRGERLVCTYNDSRRDANASRLPLERVADCRAGRGDVRWPEGAAVFDPAARFGLVRGFDHGVGPRAARIDLTPRAPHAIVSEPGPAPAARRSDPGAALAENARFVPGIVGVTVGPRRASLVRTVATK